VGKNQSNFRRRAARHWLGGFTALGSCALAMSCAVATDGSDSTASGDESVAQTGEALTYCPNPVACNTVTSLKAVTDTTGSAAQLARIAKDTGNALADAYQKKFFAAGGDLFSLYSDITSSAPDLYAGIDCLNAEVACIAQGLDWQIKASDWSHQYNEVAKALMDIPVGFVTGSTDDTDSHQGVMDSGAINMFARTYVASSTDGDGQWKAIVYPNAPTLVGPNNVYDWGAGFSRYMSLIPRRIAILGYLDPFFSMKGIRNLELEGSTSDPSTDPLPGYRHVLQQRLKQMLDGVRCGVRDRVGTNPYTHAFVYGGSDIACADVNTGLSAETFYVIPNYASCFWMSSSGAQVDANCVRTLPGQYQVAVLKDGLLRQVLAKMPIFDVNSMIDSLRRLTHPWSADLTQATGRIPLSANRNLCLDLPAANPASGTALQIWGCNGTTAQSFSYNRAKGTITQTAVGKCMQVRPTYAGDNRSQGATVEISDCLNPPPLRQQWTYDQEHGTIRSALGTVVEVTGNNQTQGTPITTRDYNGGPAQQWYPERNQTYCQNLCTPFCSATRPDDSSCPGGCMVGCLSGPP
jgi:hypothetical protein